MVTSPLQTAVCTLIAENLTSLRAIVVELGDDHVNTTPALPGANSCYAIVFHCTEMLKSWLGSVIGGERIPRDRAAEFTARGTVADLEAAIDDVSTRIDAWVHIALTEGPRDRTSGGSTRTADVADASPEWMLLHVVRELSQHLGQVEISRDILLAG